MRRFLLVLLTVLLAFPAVAAPLTPGKAKTALAMPSCHQMAPSREDRDQGHRDSKAKAYHLCIGCIPPVSALPPIARVAITSLPPLNARESAFVMLAASAPEPPPPKS